MSDKLAMSRNYESAVSHLSKEQLDQLIADYYAGKKINDLLRKYEVQCHGGYLYKAFPPVVCEDLPCPYCAEPMYHDRQSRSSIALRYLHIDHYCPACGHRDNPNCSCTNCRAVIGLNRRLALDSQREMANAFCRQLQLQRRGRVAAEELSLREAVLLLTLVRTCTFLDQLDSQGNAVLGTLANATLPLAPGRQSDLIWIRHLIHSDLASISDLSLLNAFDFLNEELVGYFPSRVNWALTVEEPLLLLEKIEQLAANPGKWPEAWHQDTLELWHEVSLEECKEYFTHTAAERGLPEAGEKSTETMLKNLLNDYSVSQCYRIIYAGAQQAADFLVRTRCMKLHAANYMIGACQRWADKARTEKWDVGHFRRRFDLPRSALSYVLFDVFLGIGEKGFTDLAVLQPPRREDEAECQGSE